MPFKTKRRKLAAGKHRVTISEGGIFRWDGPEGTGSSIKAEYGAGEIKTDAQEADDVKRGLWRIIWLAGVIIGLQLALKLVNLPFLA